jgi:hypothetical protein
MHLTLANRQVFPYRAHYVSAFVQLVFIAVLRSTIIVFEVETRQPKMNSGLMRRDVIKGKKKTL